jgi:hypothetical protein
VAILAALTVAIALVLAREHDGTDERQAPRTPPTLDTAEKPRATPDPQRGERGRGPAAEPKKIRSRRRSRAQARRRDRAHDQGRRSPRMPRSDTLRDDEAVVPNRANCTGPEGLDQLGCAPIEVR